MKGLGFHKLKIQNTVGKTVNLVFKRVFQNISNRPTLKRCSVANVGMLNFYGRYMKCLDRFPSLSRMVLYTEG